MNLKRKMCDKTGCPNVHTNPGGRCSDHLKPTNRPDIASRHERGYTNAWARASKAYLRQNPWCVCDECRVSAKPRPADCVDHIKAHKGDMRLFWDKRNWRSMNSSCHGVKTVAEDGGFGR